MDFGFSSVSIPYVELRTHSAFSFGDGAVTPEALAARAAALGYDAVGLTDSADLGGAIRFGLECARQGVRAVVGAELKVDGHPAAFLARDLEGWRNLAALVTRARIGHWDWWRKDGEDDDATAEALGREGRLPPPDAAAPAEDPHAGPHAPGRAWAHARSDRRQPGKVTAPPKQALVRRGHAAVGWDDVATRSAGLVALTGPPSGEIGYLLHRGRPREAARALGRWREVFGERLAVEVQRHNVSGGEAALAAALIELADAEGVRWVAANDARYLDGSSRLVHDLLTALRSDVCVDTAASWGLLHPNGEWRLKSPREMASLWRGHERGLEESARIAGECAFSLRWLAPPLPRFPCPDGRDDDAHLRELTYAGACTRWGELDERQCGQLDHELGVIARLGFAGFFLVMWDAVRFARARGILCQGRGSAANSAVAYCLGITAVDPVRHGLLFERFLSEVRTDGMTEAPDIDVDFEMERREEVLDYMYRTWGRRRAAITCTTLTYRAPSALQDVMRGLGYPAEQAFNLSKRLHRHDPGEGADYLAAELAPKHGLDLSGSRGRALLAAMRAMQDLPRLRGTHPGGFVLSSIPLGETMPIEGTGMGRTIIQYDKDDLDAAGVPKFDFLGLGGLSVIHRAFDAIETRTGRRHELYELPTDDPRTYELIARGDTLGTFQIESRAQIASILQTRPGRLYDIVVQVALIRPGPIQARFVHPYTARRRGEEEVTYSHPDLEPILRRTYGIPIFQEQAMALSMALGGFSAAEADELRRAMGHQKKLPRLTAALEKLKARVAARGIDPGVAEDIVNDLYSFANYGFPESHAWSFGLIAYATAWLKANHPTEFLLGLLNSWPMGFYPPATLVHDARRHGAIVLPPCMKRGAWECTTEPIAPDHPAVLSTRAEREAYRASLAREAELLAEMDARGPEPRTGAQGATPAAGRQVIEDDSPTVPPLALRVGWRYIRGLGDKARDALRGAVEEGPFASIEDVVRRARLTRHDGLHIARSGAFEAFQPGRRRAAWQALRIAGDTLPLAPARREEPVRGGAGSRPGRPRPPTRGRGTGRTSRDPARRGLASRIEGPLPFDPEELEGDELVLLDYLATGICTHGHPMRAVRGRLAAAGITDSRALRELRGGEWITVAGLVVIRQRPATAKGTVFLLMEDEAGFINVIVSKPLVERYREIVSHAPFVIVEGRFERQERVINVVGKRFRTLEASALAFRSRDFR
jgi:error-prone DNA polymerase